MVLVEIDPSDRELFLLMKAISDSGFEDIEAEHNVLMALIEEKGRWIRYTHDIAQNKVVIDFPKKKRFGIF